MVACRRAAYMSRILRLTTKRFVRLHLASRIKYAVSGEYHVEVGVPASSVPELLGAKGKDRR